MEAGGRGGPEKAACPDSLCNTRQSLESTREQNGLLAPTLISFVVRSTPDGPGSVARTPVTTNPIVPVLIAPLQDKHSSCPGVHRQITSSP